MVLIKFQQFLMNNEIKQNNRKTMIILLKTHRLSVDKFCETKV